MNDTTPKQEAHTATPRTDAAVIVIDEFLGDGICNQRAIVEPDFARTLERRNAAFVAALEEIADMATQSLAAGAARRALELARTPTPGEKP